MGDIHGAFLLDGLQKWRDMSVVEIPRRNFHPFLQILVLQQFDAERQGSDQVLPAGCALLRDDIVSVIVPPVAEDGEAEQFLDFLDMGKEGPPRIVPFSKVVDRGLNPFPTDFRIGDGTGTTDRLNEPDVSSEWFCHYYSISAKNRKKISLAQ